MQDLGKILMIPKGNYDGLATYEFLDVVNHNEASWICKKDCRGQEPSDTNTEYWQKIGTAVDLQPILNGTTQVGNAKTLDGHGAEYFLPKSGGEVNGNVVVDKKATSAAETLVKVVNTLGGVGLIISDGGNHGIWSNVHNKWLLKSELNGYTVVDAVATRNLPLTGGRVGDGVSSVPLTIDGGTSMAFVEFGDASKNRFGGLGFTGKDIPAFIKADRSAAISLLHTGNKPTGTYTGNGESAVRAIETNGTGSAIAVWGRLSSSTTLSAIVLRNGTFHASNDATSPLYSNQMWKNDKGGLYIGSEMSTLFNVSGVQYEYAVL